MPSHIKQRVIDCWDKKYHPLDELRNRMLVQEYDENKWQLSQTVYRELDNMRGTPMCWIMFPA